jgi:hypothetical protein
MSEPQGHCAAGRIMSMKNSSDTIGNRNRDLPASSIVPQPTAPPRAPTVLRDTDYIVLKFKPPPNGVYIYNNS